MLYYPPPSMGPLFQFLANNAFLQSPDQWLSPELSFSFDHTRPEMWRLKKCSTIYPLPGVHCLSILQVRLFWKAPTIGRGFAKMHCLLETETVGPWKGADSRALFEPPDLCVGVTK